MFEKLVEWAGVKAARAAIHCGWFMVRQMREDAARLERAGRSDAAEAIHKGADELTLKICGAEVELTFC